MAELGAFSRRWMGHFGLGLMVASFARQSRRLLGRGLMMTIMITVFGIIFGNGAIQVTGLGRFHSSTFNGPIWIHYRKSQASAELIDFISHCIWSMICRLKT